MMRVLSLFDGISCGQVALHRAGIVPSIYYASEIDTHAITVTQKNFPKTIQLGNVKEIYKMVSNVDLLIGGSPCQGFSNIGIGKGIEDERSKLFFDYLMIKNLTKPKWFLLENVRMKKSDCDIITRFMGVEPIEINSAFFSAQNRKRLYWTNIPISEIKSIIDWNVNWLLENDDEPNTMKWHSWLYKNFTYVTKKNLIRIVQDHKKALTMVARQFANYNGNIVRINPIHYRFLTPIECERLQTLPDGYTDGIPKMERYKTLGNGWTVDVIAHILRGIR